MSLEQQIQEKSQDISTDSLSMSVGELVSLYKDDEIDIHPEFQRFFRWTEEQKSCLIESLLLGIPIPPIFVSQTEKGKWDVIDGLQRLSTIFQLIGVLKKDEVNYEPQLVLSKTRYLPEMEGKKWESEDESLTLPDTAKLIIKRARLDIKIVLNKSDAASKYELFQRLNTGGTQATDQEIRNCILLMVNRDFFTWLQLLAQDENFKACIPLSERAFAEQFDLELVVRFLILRTMPEDELVNIGDLGPFLTDNIIKYAETPEFNRATEEEAFRKTFRILAEALGEDSFRKYDPAKGGVSGAVLISLFEVLALGIGFYAHDNDYTVACEQIVEKHHSLQNRLSTRNTGSGVSASRRIPVTVKLGRDIFNP